MPRRRLTARYTVSASRVTCVASPATCGDTRKVLSASKRRCGQNNGNMTVSGRVDLGHWVPSFEEGAMTNDSYPAQRTTEPIPLRGIPFSIVIDGVEVRGEIT